jgi:hypothetical protein
LQRSANAFARCDAAQPAAPGSNSGAHPDLVRVRGERRLERLPPVAEVKRWRAERRELHRPTALNRAAAPDAQ